MSDDRISARSITKVFPGTRALDSVDFAVRRGEIHALVGENGAGKSTLSRIMAGALSPDEGTVLLDGEEARFRTTADAIARGVVLVPQELMLVPRLSIAQNVWLGRSAEQPGRLQEVMAGLGADLSPTTPIYRLDRSRKQLVQLARGLCLARSVLLLDEPTEGLTAETYDRLKQILGDATDRGLAAVYVSHRLPEVLRLADRITVLRDGELVETFEAKETTERALIKAMANKSLAQTKAEPAERVDDREILLSVRSLAGRSFTNVSFGLKAGEVVGLAGVPGSGIARLLRALAGCETYADGEVIVGGERLPKGSPPAALDRGVAFLPADRIHEGVVGAASLRTNVILSDRKATVRYGLRALRAEVKEASSLVQRLRIRTPHVDTEVKALSGGNQQKVLFARLTLAGARVWLLEEPTQGVDVGGKAEIHQLIREAASAGRAVLVASSEMDELIDIADRIIVMRMGQPVGELDARAANPEDILSMSLPEPIGAG